MTLKDEENFAKLISQLKGLYDEMSLLSKKAPNDAVNVFKLRFINTLLGKANKMLGASYRPFADFAQFEEDNVPYNSDAVFILSQYLKCCERLQMDTF